MSALLQLRPYVRAVGDEPLPGYRLTAPLGQGGFGEVWKCVAPGGLHKAIKFVHDDGGADDSSNSLRQEYDAFQRVKEMRHPFLLGLERVELARGELVMVMELADQSLGQRFDECRAGGLPGVPRNELLAYMVDAAEALDVLCRDHGLQHLDVKPANLFVMGGHVKVGDYGLVSRFRPAHGQAADDISLARGLTPRYVAPEVLDEKVSERSDQYPLALVYYELLTGKFPYPSKNARQYLIHHKSADPDLGPLPPPDRPAVARALSKDPAARFPTCLDFVKALMTGERPVGSPVRSTATILASVTRRVPPGAATPPPSGSQAVEQTFRYNPTLPLAAAAPADAALAPAADDLARVLPGFAADLRPGPRGRTGIGTDPVGAPVRVHLLRLDGGAAADLEAALRGIAADHPRLWQTVYAPHPRAVAFVTPAAHRPLADLIRERAQPDALPLRPREAADLLAPAADALDDLHRRARLPHLLVSPHTVLTADGGTGLTGYGVGELLRRSRPDLDWLADDPYLAPEVRTGRPHPASDQYSLARVYLELVRAWAPSARGRTGRADATAIDWSAVGKTGRDAVRRALAVDPAARFPTCRGFIDAVRPPAVDGVVLDEVNLVESVARLTGGTPGRDAPPSPTDFAAALVTAASAAPADPTGKGSRPADPRFTVRFPVKWTPRLGDLKAAAFADARGYQVVQLAADTALLKPLPGCTGGPVELTVRWPTLAAAAPAEVTVTGRSTTGLHPSRGSEQVAAALDLFRKAVQNADDRRRAPRHRADWAVTLHPVDDELQVGEPVRGKCRDVSATGFGLALDGEWKGTHAFAAFAGVSAVAGWAVLAKVVRTGPGVRGLAFVGG